MREEIAGTDSRCPAPARQLSWVGKFFDRVLGLHVNRFEIKLEGAVAIFQISA